MKKLIALGLTALIFCAACSTSRYKNMQITLPDLSGKADGVYRGEVNFSGTPIKVTLDVTLRKEVIGPVSIVKHICSPIGKKAEKIIESIVREQSLDVDVVSGATLSSNAILKAVETALR